MSFQSPPSSPLAAGHSGTLSGSSTYRRTYTDFCSLETALLSGDLAAARAAFTRLIEDSPPLAELLSKHPFSRNSYRLRAFRKLGRCLSSGDLQGAKVAAEEYQ